MEVLRALVLFLICAGCHVVAFCDVIAAFVGVDFTFLSFSQQDIIN